MRRALALGVATALVAAPVASAASPPSLGRAAAAVLLDARDGDVILEKRPDKRRAIASTTKLMTALLALERAKPSDVFTAPRYDALPAESKIGLRAGERMTVQDLLEALLLESANDAAVTIAKGVAGSLSRFVAEMNQRAAELGLTETRYANPIGLDDQRNYSTARDLSRLAILLMRNPRFARIVDRPESVLQSGLRRRVVENRNLLVGRYRFVDGIKTGHTLRAGWVLIGAAHGRGGAQVVSVVLGEPSEVARDADTLALLRHGLAQFHPVRALLADRSLARARVKHRDDRVELVPERGLTVAAGRGERIERRVHAPEELEGPLPEGRRVGSVTVLRDGKTVDRVALVTARNVPAAGTLRVIFSVLGVPLTLLLLSAILVTAALVALRVRVRLRLREDRKATRAR
jgi:D-alanyl-D-alanine carboxypeptidase (penicillin-binding protein 5/6)